MIRSMTGYGKAEAPLPAGRLVAEIRSVNHRYGDISIKIPRALMEFENDVRKAVAVWLKRGKIEVFLQIAGGTEAGGLPVLNLPLARAYHGIFVRMKEELEIEDPITLALLAAQKDVLAGGGNEDFDESLHQELLSLVESALEKTDAMRRREGAILLEDLKARRGSLSMLIGKIAERAPEVMAETGKKLKERVSLLIGDCGVDEARLAQEIAFMADRGDITEELVRFNSHLCQFDETLLLDEPVGRKLDFLVQELNREVNTIGSKANDVGITTIVVQLKAELEKIREQVQNIE